MKLSDLAQALGAELIGQGSLEVDRAVHPADACRAGDLALAMEPKLAALLPDSPARAALVVQGQPIPEGALDGLLVVRRPRYALAGVLDVFDRPVHRPPGIHPTAVIDEGAELGQGVSIAPFVYVGPGARIGEGTALLAHVSVGAEARIGAGCLVHSGARIGDRVVVGDRVIIHHNASLGADGFSFVTPDVGSVESAKASGRIEATNQDLVRINSIGTVVLEDDVEVGACSAIDRGTVQATTVGKNTKIDDLVLIGHNCQVGSNCLICGQVGLAGSCVIGDRVVLGGKVGVADHVTIGNDSVIAGGSGVARQVPPRSLLAGFPAMPKEKAMEQVLYASRLKAMYMDIVELKRRVAVDPRSHDQTAGESARQQPTESREPWPGKLGASQE